MGKMADLIADDLGDVDPREMSEHFRAVASLTSQQIDGMLGWAQQGQDGAVYRLAYILQASGWELPLGAPSYDGVAEETGETGFGEPDPFRGPESSAMTITQVGALRVTAGETSPGDLGEATLDVSDMCGREVELRTQAGGELRHFTLKPAQAIELAGYLRTAAEAASSNEPEVTT